MTSIKGKLYPRSVKGKIIAGFALAVVAIMLAFFITRFAFTDMLSKVDELSEPNPKLTLLNRVFLEVTTLDQLQRAEAIRNPRMSHTAFLNQSQRTTNLIDSMLLLEWDPVQENRISAMKDVLHNRDSLFFSYLKLKSNLVDNRSLTKKIDTLSSILEQKRIEVDSSVVTTQKKTTTTYLRDSSNAVKDERTFFGKIFGSKKKKPVAEKEPVIEVKEETNVIVDTLAVATQNRALEEVEKIVRDLESDQRTQSKQLLARELELINTNNLLVNQLLSILREVETEELQLIQRRSSEAGVVVSQSIRRISLLLLAFFLGTGILIYLIWVDITRSNYYKLQLEKARDEAEELSQIKQRFLANMSHEIRTPLQSIIGFSEHLKSHSISDKEAVDAIHSSSEHLLHIVNEVLDYSRISSGAFTFARERFDLFTVIQQVSAAMRIQAEKKNLAFFVNLEKAFSVSLIGDAFRLRQILYNVIGNAIKFTTKGHVKLDVRTYLEGDKVQCEFQVRDTGIGIRKEDIVKIFNQFEQANATIAGTFGGTGLGLTIVKSLIESQGGKLVVESEAGAGSTFTIHLAFDKAVGAEVELKKAAPATIPVHAGKVLVVDDDKMILRLCGLILTKFEITHTLYDDSETLLHEKVDPAVTHVLMDIRMPKINGIELCHALRKVYPPKTKFIALTAHVFEQEKKALLQEGFDVVLTKPFHEEIFMRVLGSGLSEHTEAAKNTGTRKSGIDLEPLRKITMNDEGLLQIVIQQFREETTHELGILNNAIDEKDLKMIRELVHKFAGRIGQIGLMPLSQKLREIELEINDGISFEAILPVVLEAKEEVKVLLQALESVVESPNH
jgi:signal transduction histidine kinase/FixJ family two-component response regulator